MAWMLTKKPEIPKHSEMKMDTTQCGWTHDELKNIKRDFREWPRKRKTNKSPKRSDDWRNSQTIVINTEMLNWEWDFRWLSQKKCLLIVDQGRVISLHWITKSWWHWSLYQWKLLNLCTLLKLYHTSKQSSQGDCQSCLLCYFVVNKSTQFTDLVTNYNYSN